MKDVRFKVKDWGWNSELDIAIFIFKDLDFLKWLPAAADLRTYARTVWRTAAMIKFDIVLRVRDVF